MPHNFEHITVFVIGGIAQTPQALGIEKAYDMGIIRIYRSSVLMMFYIWQ